MTRCVFLALVVLACACGSSERGDRRAFLVAAENGSTRIVKDQLEAGVGPDDVFNIGDRNALYLAATNGHEETVKALLDAGADPTAQFQGSSLKTEVQAFRARLKDLHSDPAKPSGTYKKQDGTVVDLRSLPVRDESYDRVLKLIEDAAKRRAKK